MKSKNTPPANPPTDKWAAEKQAFLQGKKIESRQPGSNHWFELEHPVFDSLTLEYRIKPEPHKVKKKKI